MNEMPPTASLNAARPVRSAVTLLLWIALPLAVLGAALWWLFATDPLRAFDNGAPPVENLAFERTILDADGIRLLVRAGGSEPMRIAQVQVDGAYWQFTQEPAGNLARGAAAWIQIPFPWIAGDAYAVNIVTATGATFEHEIEVAVATPSPSARGFASQAMLGALVGILPVAIGLMFYPVLREVGRTGLDFLLALTIGLLVFLLIDAMDDALEIAGEAAAIFQGSSIVFLAAAASFLLLMAVARRRGAPSGLALATFIALGIGLHNLGEGLAIGAAFAAGAAGLGTFLVTGFTLHNITEGIGIAAPILRERPPLWAFGALILLAGGPAVLGLWIGSLAFAPHWSALALAIGGGAIAQVVVEISAYLARSSGGFRAALSPAVVAGLVAGVGVMYATAMLVKI